MTQLLRRRFLQFFAGTPIAVLICGASPDISTGGTDDGRYGPERPVDCRSYHMDRLKHASSVAEVVYLEKWMSRNDPSAFSWGIPTVWYLRGDKSDPSACRVGWSGEGTPYLPTTRDEERMAAAFAQWLGTNVGLGFIVDCENEIARREGRSPYKPPRSL